MFSARHIVFFLSVSILFAYDHVALGQGLGGVHSIRGTIFLPSGRVLERQIKVELQSTTHPTQTDYSDINGAFVFSALPAGTYTVVIDAGDLFEVAREYLQIDREPQGRTFRIAPIPKNIKVPIYLRQKPAERIRNEVLNAKWAAIPREAVQHFKRGLDLLRAGSDKDAEAAFRAAVAAAPNFAPAYAAIGSLEMKAGKLESAVESLKRAIQFDSNDFDANVNLGIAYVNLRKYDDAEPALLAAAYINREAVTPHYYLGIIFFLRHDLDVARKAFETAKQLKDPKSLPLTHRYLGQVYEAKKMHQEAVAEFETYINLVPEAKDAEGVRKAISDIRTREKKN